MLLTSLHPPALHPQPLVREGRMDKFFYEPDRGEMAQMIGALFAPQLDAAAVGALLDAFPAQPLDFFAAIRSRLVDSSVRSWLQESASSDEVRWRGRVWGCSWRAKKKKLEDRWWLRARSRACTLFLDHTAMW